MENKEIFSPEWAEEWKQAINQSEEYLRSGKTWNTPLILRFVPLPEHIEEIDALGFYLDLHKGKCRQLRYATRDDIANTKIVLSAAPEIWTEIIKKKKEPVFQLLSGNIKIEKGNLLELTAQKDAAKALLGTAHAITNTDPPKISNSKETDPSESEQTFMERTRFVTTGRGLDMDSYPIKLFQKAKKLGIWDPGDISFKTDILHWQQLSETEREALMHLSSLFMAGEEAVTLDLLPMMKAVANEGRLEEEIYLTSFLWEEAKHTEFFYRFVQAVMEKKPDFDRYHGPAYKKLFYQELPAALTNLYDDPRPANQMRASVVYNMIVEGTLAETGYKAFHQMLETNNLMPGLLQGMGYLKQDESRHIAFGIYLLNRIISDHKELTELFESEMSRLLELSIQIIHEIFEPYDPMPFGMEKEWFVRYASEQFEKRISKILGVCRT